MRKPISDAWKERFREGLYASAELRSKKIHRDLLSYLLYRANRKNRFCWSSQAELARVQGCSVRNIKDLMDYLVDLGAIFPVRIADMPSRDQVMIKVLTPLKVTRNANAYYLCEEWAKDQLDQQIEESAEAGGKGQPSADDQAKGRAAGNDRRRRYAPIWLDACTTAETNPVHDDWLVLNAVGDLCGSPTSPLKSGETGSPTTDMTIEYNPAANSATDLPRAVASFVPLPSKENSHSGLISSLPDQHGASLPHGYGGGAAGTPGSKAAGFGLPEGARLEGTELGVAGARANERRVQ